MASLVLTVREAFRYRGRSGQVSWIAHRLAGLAILGFVVIHIWDTANAFFAPHIYAYWPIHDLRVNWPLWRARCGRNELLDRAFFERFPAGNV